MPEGEIDGKEYQAPHCNTSVLHAPGECYYCDHYPGRQAAFVSGGIPFTPNEANGWSGNVAVKAGEEHTHMLSTYVVGENSIPRGKQDLGPCDRAPRGFRCKLRKEHDGPCPAWAKWWKKIELRVRTGTWWP